MNEWLQRLPIPARQLGIAVLIVVAVMAVGSAAIVLARNIRERRLALLRSRGEILSVPTESSRLTASLGSVGRTVASGQFSRQLQVQLTRAGFTSNSAPSVYVGAKIVLVLIGLCLGTIGAIALHAAFHVGLFLAVFVGCAFFVIPNLFVAARRDSRMGELRRRLPDAIDLLESASPRGWAWTWPGTPFPRKCDE